MKVQLPDGKIAEFPDDMPQEAIAEVIKQQYLSPSREIDTRTSMAVPTFNERAQAGSTLIRQGLPIFGDVALSVASRRLMTPFTGALRMGPKIGGMVKAAGQAAGAGVGSGLGELAAQKVFDEPIDLDMVSNQMMYGAATDLSFSALTKLAGTTLKYLQKNTSGGQRATKVIAGNILDKTTERAEKFVNDLAPESIRGQTNILDDINLKMSQADLESHAKYSVYKDALKTQYEKNGEIELQNTWDYLEKLREEVASNNPMGSTIKEGALSKTNIGKGESRLRKDIALKRYLYPVGATKQRRNIDELLTAARTGEPVELGTVDDLLANVFGKWGDLTTVEKSRIQGFKEALLKDLDDIPIEYGGTVKTAKDAADLNFKAIRKFSTVLGIYNKSISEDAVGNITFKPKKFAREVLMKERVFTAPDADPVLKEMWPRLKAEAEEYARVSKILTSKEMKPDVGGNWMDVLPVSSFFGKMSAYAMLDPASQAVIQRIVRYGGPVASAGAKAGSKVLGSEFGFTNRDE